MDGKENFLPPNLEILDLVLVYKRFFPSRVLIWRVPIYASRQEKDTNRRNESTNS